MTIEKFTQAGKIIGEMEAIQGELDLVDTIILDSTEPNIRIKVKGMSIELPKQTLIAEAKKKKTVLRKRLTELETELNAL